MADMPAKIWAYSGGVSVYTPERPANGYFQEFIRADLVEQMADALRDVLGCAQATNPEMTVAYVNADAALQAYEAGQ